MVYYKIVFIDKSNLQNSQSSIITKKFLSIWKYYLSRAGLEINKIDSVTYSINAREGIYLWYKTDQAPSKNDIKYMNRIEEIISNGDWKIK